jgi:hypothetical protein
MFYLLLIGLLIFLGGYLLVAQKIGLRHGLIWGLLFIPFPLILIVYGVTDWKEIKRPFIVSLVGLLLFLVAIFGGGIKGTERFLRQYGFGHTVERSATFADQAKSYVFGVSSTPYPGQETSLASEKLNDAPTQLSEVISSDPQQEEKQPLVYRIYPPTSLTFQERDVNEARHYIYHRVRVHLKSGLVREATLMKVERFRLFLKNQSRSGYLSYEVPMDIVTDFFVLLPTTEAESKKE